MSWVEDGRKLVQDFLTPELRAIAVRLDSLERIVEANESRADKRFQRLEAHIDKRFQSSEAQFDKRLQASESHLEKRFQTLHGSMQEMDARSEKRHAEGLAALDKLTDYHAVLVRLARLEEKVVQPTQ